MRRPSRKKLKSVGKKVATIAGRTAADVLLNGNPLIVSISRVIADSIADAKEIPLPAMIDIAKTETGRDVDEAVLAALVDALRERVAIDVKIATILGTLPQRQEP